MRERGEKKREKGKKKKKRKRHGERKLSTDSSLSSGSLRVRTKNLFFLKAEANSEGSVSKGSLKAGLSDAAISYNWVHCGRGESSGGKNNEAPGCRDQAISGEFDGDFK